MKPNVFEYWFRLDIRGRNGVWKKHAKSHNGRIGAVNMREGENTYSDRTACIDTYTAGTLNVSNRICAERYHRASKVSECMTGNDGRHAHFKWRDKMTF